MSNKTCDRLTRLGLGNGHHSPSPPAPPGMIELLSQSSDVCHPHTRHSQGSCDHHCSPHHPNWRLWEGGESGGIGKEWENVYY